MRMHPIVILGVAIVLSLFPVDDLVSLTTYYVDPDWGGTKSGSSANPWSRLESSAWTAINTALSGDNVVVYFSAREAGSDADEVSNTALNIQRTSSSTYFLTFDGMSMYNTSDSAPSWSSYSGSSRFKMMPGGTGSFTPIAAYSGRQSRVTVRGFRVEARSGQCVYYYAGDYVTLEYIDATHLADSTNGPGIYFEYANRSHLPSSYVTIRNCYVHDTQGEGIYFGGGENSGTAGHSNIVIENNVVRDPATRGGEPDCIDIKDANTNIRVSGNTLYMSSAGQGRDGITVEGVAVIEGNFIHHMGRSGISLSEFWDAATGYRNGGVISNNVIVECGGNPTYQSEWPYGIQINHKSGNDDFRNTGIYNNTIYKIHGMGIHIDPGCSGIQVKNNVVADCDGVELYTGGSVSSHDYNNLYDQAGVVVQNGSSTYTAAQVSSYEMHALSVDPQFTSVAEPYTADNFRPAASSAIRSWGEYLADVTDDFAGTPRPTSGGYDLGAFQASTGAFFVPPPPTRLRMIQ